MNRFKNQRGDTIVEVLIAIAIVSFVLVLAFALSSHATNTVRDSQEHSEALKLAESQLEQVQASTSGLDTSANNCFGVSGAPASAGDCKFASNGGGTCTEATNGYCYTVRVTTDPSVITPSSPYKATLYHVAVTWERLGGGNNKVSLAYRALSPNSGYTPVGPSVVVPTPPPVVIPSGVTVGETGSSASHCTSRSDCPGKPVSSFTYHYLREFTVDTVFNIDPSDVTSCTWNWGDTTSSNFAAGSNCAVLTGSAQHTFPEVNGQLNGAVCDPATTTYRTYAVTFTDHRSKGGDVSSAPTTVYAPTCYAQLP